MFGVPVLVKYSNHDADSRLLDLAFLEPRKRPRGAPNPKYGTVRRIPYDLMQGQWLQSLKTVEPPRIKLFSSPGL